MPIGVSPCMRTAAAHPRGDHSSRVRVSPQNCTRIYARDARMRPRCEIRINSQKIRGVRIQSRRKRLAGVRWLFVDFFLLSNHLRRHHLEPDSISVCRLRFASSASSRPSRASSARPGASRKFLQCHTTSGGSNSGVLSLTCNGSRLGSPQ